MLRRLIAVFIVGLVVRIAAQQSPAPSAPPPAAGATTPAPQFGRGGDPNAAIGAPFGTTFIPPPDPPPQPVGAGVISGVVTDARTGAPLEGVRVGLSGGYVPSPSRPFNRPPQMTDSKGRYIFTNLPASPPTEQYRVFASRPGYISGGYKWAPGATSGDSFRLAEGEWLRDANFKLSKPGSISGIVRDERGEPFVGIPIRILVGKMVAGRLRWAEGQLTKTDDRGIYRFAELSQGRYLVHVPSIQISLPSGEAALYRPPPVTNTAAATPSNQTRDVLNVARGSDGSGVVAGLFAAAPPDDKGSVYASVFHPTARSLDQAEPIVLGFGAERTGIDIQMTPVPSVTVSGTLSGPADAVAGVPVRILPTGNELLGLVGDTGLTKADALGRFTFHHIPSGDYLIVASRSVAVYKTLDYSTNGDDSSQTLLPGGANPFYFQTGSTGSVNGAYLMTRLTREADVTGRLQVNVGNRPLSGLVVPVAPAVSVSGHLEWDGSITPSDAVAQSLVLVRMQPADGDFTLNYHQQQARTNGGMLTFTFDSVKPGRYVFDNVPLRPLYRLVGATWNGRDVLSTPLEVSGDGPVTGIVLHMSTQTNKVAGSVRGADGRVASEGAVIAFPPSPDALLDSGLSAIRFQTTAVAADGTYELPPMIPGDYLVAAISTEDRARWLDPEFLKFVSPQATRVSLGPASILSQDLRTITISGGQR